MGGRSAAPLAAALWLGILLGRTASSPVALAVALALLMAAWLARHRPRPAVVALLLLAALAAGAARGAAQHESLERSRTRVDPSRLYRLRVEVLGPPALAADHVAIVARVLASQPPLPRGSVLRIRLPQDARPE